MPVKFGRNSNKFRFNSIATAMLLVAVVILLSRSSAPAQQAAPKRIMVLYWYGKDWPTNDLHEQSLQAVFQSALGGNVEYYPEYLEADRFPGDDQAAVLCDYLQKKYARRPIDVVVAMADAPLRFLLKHRDELFPQAPIVFASFKLPTEKELMAGPGLTGIIQTFSYKQTLDLALKLHPGTEQVFIISGTLNHDKTYEILGREKLQGYENRLSITYLTDLSPKELIDKTKSLPDRSIILYVWQQVYNEQGKILESRDVLSLMASSAQVPIYGLASWQVGNGIVGGYVRVNSAATTKLAEIALQVANGERAQNIPVETLSVVPMFDWRQLKRWGIREALLPLGSTVNFRVPSFWDAYKWYAIGFISVVMVQSLLITGLIINRTRRKRAEEALRESEARFRNMADTAPVMIWISGLDKRCTYFNQQWLNFTGRTMEEELGDNWGEWIHPDDYEHCLGTYNSAFDRRQSLTMEYRLQRVDGQYLWVLDSGTARFAPGGEFLGYIGSCIDISARKTAEERLKDLSGQLIWARENECARIARELHDDLNQRMALIAIELEQLGQKIPQSDNSLREHLKGILKQTNDVSREIHQISHDLHPSKLSQLGLVAALRSLCNELRSRHKLHIEFSAERVPADLSQEVSLCFYRIAQESLNNVIKHSQAETVTIELRANGKDIRLRISDSGIGFDLESPRTKKGLGLHSMRERLRLVGGHLMIHSHPSLGTHIDARVPTRQADYDYKVPSPHTNRHATQR
jgi:PAS domain S-box-containing protein